MDGVIVDKSLRGKECELLRTMACRTWMSMHLCALQLQPNPMNHSSTTSSNSLMTLQCLMEMSPLPYHHCQHLRRARKRRRKHSCLICSRTPGGWTTLHILQSPSFLRMTLTYPLTPRLTPPFTGPPRLQEYPCSDCLLPKAPTFGVVMLRAKVPSYLPSLSTTVGSFHVSLTSLSC